MTAGFSERLLEGISCNGTKPTWLVPPRHRALVANSARPQSTNLSIFPMKRLRVAISSVALGLLTSSHVGADILADLESVTPLYDSLIKGVVNDSNNGPGQPGNLSGVPAIEDTGTYTHAAGLTLYT